MYLMKEDSLVWGLDKESRLDHFFKDEKRYKFQMQNNSSMKGTAEKKDFF